MLRLPAPLTILASALTCLLGSCSQTEPATQVLVVVRSDLALGRELDALEVRVLERDELGNDARPTRQYSLASEPDRGQHALPMSFSIAPKRNNSRQDFRIVITGLRGGDAVVEQQAIASFVPERSLVLDLFLSRACLGELCRMGDGERSGRACEYLSVTCRDVEAMAELPPWRGPGTELDAGSRVQPDDLDAGFDDASDDPDGDVGESPGAGAGDDASAPLQCSQGSELISDVCADIDECAKNPTLCGAAECKNRPGGYGCGDCESGYGPNADGSCVDLDECALAPAPCDTDPLATCSNLRGSFRCVCPSGSVGNGNGAQGCVSLLTGLALSWGTLAPAFDPLVAAYTAPIGVWQERVLITASVASGATLRIDGTNVASGQAFDKSLSLGANLVTVLVEAGGATRSYTLTLTRGAPVERYLKASNPGSSDRFGRAISLSGDGTRLAIGAQFEGSGTSGINVAPDEAAPASGAVYVFRRAGGIWAQEAFIKASNVGASDYFGLDVALNTDGSVLAVGAPGEDSSSTSINSTPNDAGMGVGAVYVYRRTEARWAHEAYVKANNGGGAFGSSVALNGDGTVLAVGAMEEGSSSTGINSIPNQAAGYAGAAYVFRYARPAAAWAQEAYVKASNAGAGDYFGSAVALSENGSVLAVGAKDEASSTTGVSSTPNEATPSAGAAYVFRRTNNVWSEEAYLKSGRVLRIFSFGAELALSADGATLAVGAIGEATAVPGINPAPDEASWYSGATYVFRRVNRVSGGEREQVWVQDAFLKAGNPGEYDHFGCGVSLSSDGSTLVVGASGESSSSAGLNPTPDEAASHSGAAYVFRRSASAWSQQAFLKASNGDANDEFGCRISLSANGAVLAVGASGESSASRGVGSVPDEAATYSGAAYLYE